MMFDWLRSPVNFRKGTELDRSPPELLWIHNMLHRSWMADDLSVRKFFSKSCGTTSVIEMDVGYKNELYVLHDLLHGSGDVIRNAFRPRFDDGGVCEIEDVGCDQSLFIIE